MHSYNAEGLGVMEKVNPYVQPRTHKTLKLVMFGRVKAKRQKTRESITSYTHRDSYILTAHNIRHG